MTALVFGSTRYRRSAMLLGAYTRPFLSGVEDVYGPEYLSRSQRLNCFVFVSNMATLSVRYSPYQRTSCSSIAPRRPARPSMGNQTGLLSAMRQPITPPGPICVIIHGLPFEST